MISVISRTSTKGGGLTHCLDEQIHVRNYKNFVADITQKGALYFAVFLDVRTFPICMQLLNCNKMHLIVAVSSNLHTLCVQAISHNLKHDTNLIRLHTMEFTCP